MFDLTSRCQSAGYSPSYQSASPSTGALHHYTRTIHRQPFLMRAVTDGICHANKVKPRRNLRVGYHDVFTLKSRQKHRTKLVVCIVFALAVIRVSLLKQGRLSNVRNAVHDLTEGRGTPHRPPEEVTPPCFTRKCPAVTETFLTTARGTQYRPMSTCGQWRTANLLR